VGKVEKGDDAPHPLVEEGALRPSRDRGSGQDRVVSLPLVLGLRHRHRGSRRA